MSKRYWLARAARGTMMIEGLVGVYESWLDAQDARVEMQGNTQAGLSGDVFVVIDSMHIPVPDVDLHDKWHRLYDKWLRRDQQLLNLWRW